MNKPEIPPYTTQILWSAEDSCWIAVCPELRNLSAFGETQDEALAELRVAIELAVETYAEKSWTLPEPRGAEVYSGQFRLRVPVSIHRWLAEQSRAEGVSINSFIVQVLSEAKGAKKLADTRRRIAAF